ncbi:methyltransferase-like protein 25B [Mantella aurantiaca]
MEAEKAAHGAEMPPLQESLERNKRHAESITRVLSIYGYITDSYIIEFFTDNLWDSLPESWRAVLSDLPSPQLAEQLLCDGDPAEIRCHEIRQLGKLVSRLCESVRCEDVVDVGSGQGHLSRVLSFGLGLGVTAVEADSHLVTMASKFDQEILYMMKKERLRLPKTAGLEVTSFLFRKPPRHVLACVDPRAPWEDFVRQLAGEAARQGAGGNKMAAGAGRAFAEDPRRQEVGRFLLTGLHACGDLSVAMLRHFARCPGAAGITSVACCYMKLTTPEVPRPPGVLPTESPVGEFGYPMSSWVSGLPGHKLSYKSREVACHAVEDYVHRLRGESDILRTHCYRAVLETVIRGADPTMRRPGVQSIKRAHRLPFTEYAKRGLERVGLDPATPLDAASVEDMLSQQQNVVVFFSLALLLAPLVETLILLDRMIFLQEQGLQCEVIPLFKPQFSPRNLVLVAAKNISDLSDLLEEVTASEPAT